MPICKCGSSNCTIVEWNKRAKGAKKGLGGGALAGALIGLAGEPIGTIAGAVIGAAGGAVIGSEQPKDKKGRLINEYKCNSCGKKFQVCPECGNFLETYSTSRGNTSIVRCKCCENCISISEQRQQTLAQRQAMSNATQAYCNAVKNNINSMIDDD